MHAGKQEPKRRGESPYHSRAVTRALRILKSFSPDDYELSIADLHDRLGIPKSTLVRLLQCMADEGFIEYDSETSKYRLGIKLFELGSLYERTRIMNIGALARPYMEELVNAYRLSANLAIRESDEIVYIAVVEPTGALRMAYSVGDRFGLHHTALGKVLLAFLNEEARRSLVERLGFEELTPNTISSEGEFLEELAWVRDHGYALDEEESLPGQRCIAAPIRNAERVMAALSVSGSTLAIPVGSIEEIAADLTEKARLISLRLGWEPSEAD